MRNTLAMLASIALSSQRPSLASCCASAQDWKRPASASTRSSFMEKVSNTGLLFSCGERGGRVERRQQAAVRCIGGGDYCTAQANLAIVENHRLARRDSALWFIEPNIEAVVAHADEATLVGLAITGARGAAEFGGWCTACDPIRRFRLQPLRKQPAVLAALGYVQHVRRYVLADHVPRFAAGAVAPADAQAVALAEGVIHHALMLADQLAVRRTDLAGPGRQVLGQETAEIAFADETDSGGVLLRVGRQRRLAGQLAHAGFLDRAQREQRGGQLLLAQGMQEIALVLGVVDRAQQAVVAFMKVHAGVVSCGDFLGAQRVGLVQKGLELDLAIAQNIGIGRAPGAVFGEEMREYAVPVSRREVACMERYAEPAAHRHGILAVGIGGAGPGTIIFLPVLHEQTLDVVPGLLQQQGRDGRIDAAGNAEHHLHFAPPSGR